LKVLIILIESPDLSSIEQPILFGFVSIAKYLYDNLSSNFLLSSSLKYFLYTSLTNKDSVSLSSLLSLIFSISFFLSFIFKSNPLNFSSS
jgi:hypothetical protein